jgi:hypothetical protein
MAEMPRQLSQAEIDRILFLQSKGLDPRGRVPTPSIQNLQQRTSGTVTPVSPNVAQLAAGGAERVGKFVNQLFPNAEQLVAANPLNLERLFPTTNAQPQVTIPTGFNFAPKQAPTGEVIPGGLQTQQVDMSQLLQAIQPADMLGISGAQRAYTDIGLGKAPQPMDVAETMALGASGLAAGRGLLKAGKGLPVGMSIQEATGLLQTAPKSDIGFYSAVEQAAMASPRKSATGQAFLNDIMKGPDVRADEIKWMGLDEFLKNKQNVTKQEVQDYIANNRVNVQEIRSTIPRLPGEEMPGDKGAFLPKFGQYTLPGGENYRELLLTMPAKQLTEAEARVVLGAAPDAKLSPADISYASRKNVDEYRSQHFDQPNILAHLRVNDRVDADGKKMLLIEEVQSDWHQAGREKGYASEAKPSTFVLKNPETGGFVGNFATKEEAAEFMRTSPRANEFAQKGFIIDERKGKSSGIPDAPFKDTWYQLALKRAIQHAAENGYDRIGLTTGSQQAARFDLSKQISYLSIKPKSDGMVTINASKDGEPVILKDVPKENLSDYIGKEMAKKAISDIDAGKSAQYSDLDLQVGGEGMKKYYDEIYPKFLDKYGKKWGARVGETKVRTSGKSMVSPEQVQGWDLGGISPEEFVKQYNFKDGETIRYLDITPEMKAGVSKGQPLFQAAPIIGTGLLGSQQEDR